MNDPQSIPVSQTAAILRDARQFLATGAHSEQFGNSHGLLTALVVKLAEAERKLALLRKVAESLERLVADVMDEDGRRWKPQEDIVRHARMDLDDARAGGAL